MFEVHGIEKLVCQDIAKRQQFGMHKYGQSVLNNPLPLEKWLVHAYEEALDLAIYLKRAHFELVSQQKDDEKVNALLRELADDTE